MQVIGNCGAGTMLITTSQRLHSVKLMPHVLAEDAALQVGQDNFGRPHLLTQTAHQQREHNIAKTIR